MKLEGFRHPIGSSAVHLCIDMQRIFSEGGLWATPWMARVAPIVRDGVRRHPAETVFTRFITPRRADDMPGTWRRYYTKWELATRERLPPEMLDLVPELAEFVPPATVIDKMRYSAFAEPQLGRHLAARGVNTLIITGSETDVCVGATVLGAVDFGFRVIVVSDGVCSSSDEGHDAFLETYRHRFSEQIEIASAEEVRDAWK